VTGGDGKEVGQEQGEETKQRLQTKSLQEKEKAGAAAAAAATELWKGKSAQLVDAEKTLNDELDDFIDDLLL
jgi:hypothetical protein